MAQVFDFEEQWLQAYEQRLDWAYGARERFMAEFDPEFRQTTEAGQGRVAFAALYGRTQVGKTTLVLKLLGIRDELSAQLEEVLRAGRPLNNSSTATAFVYLRSPDDFFYLVDKGSAGPEERLDEPACQAALRDIRKRVENTPASLEDGNPPAHSPHNIFLKIPNRYFRETAGGFAINIIDLPGVGGGGREKKHLEYLLARNLPLSTLVIIVVESHYPTSLDALEHPRFVNWRQNPAAFRIVTTRTISNLRKQAGPHDLERIDSKERLVEHHRQAFEATLKTTLPKLYPLEYADSWKNILQNPGLERFRGIMDELVQELRDDLKTHVTPYFKLIQTNTVQNILQRQTSAQLHELTTLLQQTETALNELRASMHRHQRTRERLTTEIGALRDGKAREMPVALDWTPQSMTSVAKKYDYEKYVHGEMERLERAVWSSFHALPGLTGLNPEEATDLPTAQISRIMETTWTKLREYCKKMDADHMLFVLPSFGRLAKQEKRRKDILGALQLCRQEIEERLQQALRALVERQNAALAQKIDRQAGHLEEVSQYLSAQAVEAQLFEEKYRRQTAALQAYQTKAAGQLRHAGNFGEYLEQAYLAQQQALERRWQNPALDTPKILLHALEQALLLDEYHHLTTSEQLQNDARPSDPTRP